MYTNPVFKRRGVIGCESTGRVLVSAALDQSSAKARPGRNGLVNIHDSALVRRVRTSPRLRPWGIKAYKALDRMLPTGDGPRIIANSMPKSGTHLLGGMLGQLPRMRFFGRYAVFEYADRFDGQWRIDILDEGLGLMRPNHYMGGHLVHDPRVEDVIRTSGAKLVTILRDPRAIVVSGSHYVIDNEQMRGRDDVTAAFPTREAVLEAMVHGHGQPGDKFFLPDIGERFAAYVDWMDVDLGIIVTFEDLIGAQGGGDDELQRNTVIRLLEYLGYDQGGVSAAELADRLFSAKSATFRKGRVDSWRDELPRQLADEVARLCRPHIERLGLPL
jgi:hypothetical protein